MPKQLLSLQGQACELTPPGLTSSPQSQGPVCLRALPVDGEGPASEAGPNLQDLMQMILRHPYGLTQQ